MSGVGPDRPSDQWQESLPILPDRSAKEVETSLAAGSEATKITASLIQSIKLDKRIKVLAPIKKADVESQKLARTLQNFASVTISSIAQRRQKASPIEVIEFLNRNGAESWIEEFCNQITSVPQETQQRAWKSFAIDFLKVDVETAQRLAEQKDYGKLAKLVKNAGSLSEFLEHKLFF